MKRKLISLALSSAISLSTGLSNVVPAGAQEVLPLADNEGTITIGDTTYDSFSKAWQAAQNAGEATIKISGAVTADSLESLVIESHMYITLTGDGTLTLPDDLVIKGSLINQIGLTVRDRHVVVDGHLENMGHIYIKDLVVADGTVGNSGSLAADMIHNNGHFINHETLFVAHEILNDGDFINDGDLTADRINNMDVFTNDKRAICRADEIDNKGVFINDERATCRADEIDNSSGSILNLGDWEAPEPKDGNFLSLSVSSNPSSYRTPLASYFPANPIEVTIEAYHIDQFARWDIAPPGILEVDQNEAELTFPVKGVMGEVSCTALYGHTTPISWTVTFNNNGGTLIDPETETVESGATVTKPADPTRDGYRFTGWYTDPECTEEWDFDTPVSEDLTLYAGWIPTGQTITFNPNEGIFENAGSNSLSIFIEYGSPIGAGQKISRLGYEFLGWSTSPQGEVITETNLPEGGLEATTLYAKWDMLIYSVVLNDGFAGGSSRTETYTVVQPLDLSQFTPTREGYSFAGWYSDEETGPLTTVIVDEQSDPNVSLEIYAHWKPDTRDITYILISPNGPENTLNREQYGLPSLFTYDEGGVNINSSQVPEVPGYTFAGWYASKESEKQITVISDENYKELSGADNAITLYGRYSITNTYTVTFNANGGSFENGTQATQEVAQGQPVDFSPEGFINPVRPGYSFDGWWTTPEGGSRWLATDTVSEETTLYAHWTLNTYPVVFDANGGQLESQSSVSFDVENGFISEEGLDELPVPVFNGYEFTGWKQAGVEGETFTDPAYKGLYLSDLDDSQTITLNAQWQAIEYTITFDSNGGSRVNPVTYTIVSGYNGFPTPTNEGYTFLGWYDEDGNLVTVIDPGQYGDLTLTAKWQQNEQKPENPGHPDQPVNPPIPSVPDYPSTGPSKPEKPEPTPPVDDSNPDGITKPGSQTVENEDGSSTTWTMDEDGVQSAVDKDKDGTITDVWVSIPDDIEDETVDIPMETVPGDQSFEQSPDIKIESENENVAMIPVEDSTPSTVLAVEQADGSWSIIPDAVIKNGFMYVPVQGSHTVKIYDNTINFGDIPADYPFYKEVQFVASRGIMQGLGFDDLWGPGLTVDRGMFATVIWKLYRKPTSAASNYFNIPADTYYAQAIQWINALGLMTGYNSTNFGTDNPITRDQIVTVLWRMYGSPVVNLDISRYPDADQIAPYAIPAMKWAVSKGFIQGMDNGQLAPSADSKRYEIAVLFYRVLNSLY